MRFFQKICDLNVNPLLEQIDRHPELWGQFGWRKNIPQGPHSQMTDIWVRYNDIRNLGPHFNDEHDPIWYPAYHKLPALKEIIYPLMAAVEGERLGGVLITRIPAGCGIAPHVDSSWHVDYYDKFYVQLKSKPGALFCCGEDRLNPKPGEVWRFDNRELHWVENNSDDDRMTLIVCIRTRKFGGYNAPIAMQEAA
jgi:aspartyl/asparaginyl beta-hydroxylase